MGNKKHVVWIAAATAAAAAVVLGAWHLWSAGEPPDADGDGYVAWSQARDPALADCDDGDPRVTPATERFIPAGAFWRGKDGVAGAEPAAKVHVSAFYMDVHEVTNAQFARFLNTVSHWKSKGLYDHLDGDDPIPARLKGSPDGVTVPDKSYARHPVTEVTWAGAAAYCRSQGQRLPTEAEWEKGARGAADRRTYPWGDQAPDCKRANFSTIEYTQKPAFKKIIQCVGDTRPVGTYVSGRSPYGLYDMAGNAAEYVADRYQKDYYKQAGSRRDPRGPARGFATDEVNAKGFEAVITRGGGWAGDDQMLRVFDRHPDPIKGSSNGVGFRCARTPGQPRSSSR